MKPSVKIEGFDKIRHTLAKLARLTNRDAVEDSLLQGAEVIAAEARNLVPVRSGNLRSSIAVVTNSRNVNFSGGSLSNGTYQVYIGPLQGKGQPHDGFYGHMIEFGTVKMAAQPFIRPAFDAQADRAINVTIKHISDEFDRLTKG